MLHLVINHLRKVLSEQGNQAKCKYIVNNRWTWSARY